MTDGSLTGGGGKNTCPQTMAFYLSFFENLKGGVQTNAFTSNAICATQSDGAGHQPGAATTTPTAGRAQPLRDHGQRHQRPGDRVLHRRLGDQPPASWGRRAFGYRTRFFLSESPNSANDHLTVQINGVNFPATTAQGRGAVDLRPQRQLHRLLAAGGAAAGQHAVHQLQRALLLALDPARPRYFSLLVRGDG